jgi:septal ring factor EnvC (AmiA/AmiB activator)
MDFLTIIPTVSSVVAILIAIGTGISQFRSSKSQAKKLDVEAAEILINKAMEINKQEIEVVRSINADLQKSIDNLKTENASLHAQIDTSESNVQKLESENSRLTNRVQTLERIVEKHKNDLDTCLKSLGSKEKNK